ncbi:hypothetical protein pipiens_015352, partial [Culex pipiens pipiens]
QVIRYATPITTTHESTLCAIFSNQIVVNTVISGQISHDLLS